MAVTLPPEQVVEALGVGATTSPAVVVPGKVSVSDALVKALVESFVNVIVKVEMPLGATVPG